MATLVSFLFFKLGGPLHASCLAASVIGLPHALAHFLRLNSGGSRHY